MPVISGKNRHHVYISDTAAYKIFELSSEGEIVWEYPLSEGELVFDLHSESDGKILFCHYNAFRSGVRMIDREGRILLDYLTDGEIFSCCRLPDGKSAVAQQGTCSIVILSEKGEPLFSFPVFYDRENRHEIMRSICSSGDDALYLVQPGINQIVKYSKEGRILSRYPIHSDAFGVEEEKNGNIIYTCISGVYKIDQSGREISSFTEKDAPQLGLRWPLGFRLLENGNIIVVNWLGHGHSNKGIPAFEITPDNQIVWICDSRDTMINPSNIAVVAE